MTTMQSDRIYPEPLTPVDERQQPKASVRSRLGLALGGGGVRGLANLGVLKALVNAGLKPDLLAGTSMGGILAALYAAGFTVEEIEAEALHLASLPNVIKLVDWVPGQRGLMKGHNIYNYLTRLLGADLTFADLQIPLAVTAVDLLHREEVVLRAGCVVDALRASMAVPGVFDPVELEERRLVDGGVLNNVPADIVRQMGADVVIAVDVGVGKAYDERIGANGRRKTPFPPLTPAVALDMWQAQSIMVDQLTEYKLQAAHPDFILRPALPIDVGLFSGMNQMATVIAAGERAAEEILPQVKIRRDDERGRE